jgi:hypothetical protein
MKIKRENIARSMLNAANQVHVVLSGVDEILMS